MQADVSVFYQYFNFLSILEVFDSANEALCSAISELGKHINYTWVEVYFIIYSFTLKGLKNSCLFKGFQ